MSVKQTALITIGTVSVQKPNRIAELSLFIVRK